MSYDLLPEDVRLTLPTPDEVHAFARYRKHGDYWLIVVAVFLGMAILVFIWQAFTLKLGILGPFGAIAGMALFWLVARVFRHAWLHTIADQVINACARASICASCGYTLTGLSPESDACVICPECGAAWRAAIA